ncbi:MAG: hypothetical protein AAFV53_21920 [Myxococcota bacterium]
MKALQEQIEQVQAAQRGDAAAQQALFEAWLPTVMRWCASLGGPRVDPEDAAQDTMVQALRWWWSLAALGVGRPAGRGRLLPLLGRAAVARQQLGGLRSPLPLPGPVRPDQELTFTDAAQTPARGSVRGSVDHNPSRLPPQLPSANPFDVDYDVSETQWNLDAKADPIPPKLPTSEDS